MGLDQYAYVAMKAGAMNEYYDSDRSKNAPGESVPKPREIAYWRKHPNLQGWMEQLWIAKGRPNGSSGQEQDWGSDFNGIELELTWQDIEQLEQDVINRRLPPTRGFFFGDNGDDYYKQTDLEFVKQAKAELFSGLRVFYNSSW